MVMLIHNLLLYPLIFVGFEGIPDFSKVSKFVSVTSTSSSTLGPGSGSGFEPGPSHGEEFQTRAEELLRTARKRRRAGPDPDPYTNPYTDYDPDPGSPVITATAPMTAFSSPVRNSAARLKNAISGGGGGGGRRDVRTRDEGDNDKNNSQFIATDCNFLLTQIESEKEERTKLDKFLLKAILL